MHLTKNSPYAWKETGISGIDKDVKANPYGKSSEAITFRGNTIWTQLNI